LIDVPKDIVDPKNPRSKLNWVDDPEMDLPGYEPEKNFDLSGIDKALELIENSERPVFLCWGWDS
jgi:thiamine pyrophosphate-dependent acetolactate synthase large subunit-like protein